MLYCRTPTCILAVMYSRQLLQRFCIMRDLLQRAAHGGVVRSEGCTRGSLSAIGAELKMTATALSSTAMASRYVSSALYAACFNVP